MATAAKWGFKIFSVKLKENIFILSTGDARELSEIKEFEKWNKEAVLKLKKCAELKGIEECWFELSVYE